ncbi:MAG: IS1634 family transposase [Nostochopsis sp.]
MNEALEAIKVLDIDHLGIVAGIIDEMELVEEVNKDELESEMKPIEIVHGYSRDHRPDLKQFIIDMIVTGDGDIPLYLKVDSGNVDDKSVFVCRLKEFRKQWTFAGICVADSALYTADNLEAMRELKWITRVPLSIKEAQNKILDIQEKEWQESQTSGYKIATRESEYGKIKQRWLIIESEERKKSSIQQVKKQVDKQSEKAQASLRKLSRQDFACQADAKIAIEKLSSSWKYHQIKEIEYSEKAEYTKVGRPSKSSENQHIKYQATGQIEPRPEVIETEKIKAGRFILATNILDENELSNQQVLDEYKAQQANERGFRFLKDPLFFTSSVFVKSPERVEAIAMIMGLCLLVYNLAQRKLRQALLSSDSTIRNQVNKFTNNPTMRWIFQMFQSVHLLLINGQQQMSNLTEERQKILHYLGYRCRQYYLMI